jgi:hypothetical protein
MTGRIRSGLGLFEGERLVYLRWLSSKLPLLASSENKQAV